MKNTRNSVVVDTSIVIKWVLYEPDSPIAQALLTEWTERGLIILAPPLLVYEITNSLYQKLRRGIISIEKAQQTLKKVLTAGLEIDFTRREELHFTALKLAHDYKLPATYDAHYLALAAYEECEFWTADTRIWKAVKEQLPWVRCLVDYEPSSPRA